MMIYKSSDCSNPFDATVHGGSRHTLTQYTQNPLQQECNIGCW